MSSQPARIDEAESYPKGQTQYRNYDPDEINLISDAIEVFEWLGDQNRERGELQSAAAYEDAAEFLKENFIDE